VGSTICADKTVYLNYRQQVNNNGHERVKEGENGPTQFLPIITHFFPKKFRGPMPSGQASKKTPLSAFSKSVRSYVSFHIGRKNLPQL